MPLSKRTAKGREHLVGVNQRVPGLVDVVPSAEEFKAVKQKLAARLSAEGRGAPGQVSAYFAGGGGAATPLILPEALEVLERHVAGAA